MVKNTEEKIVCRTPTPGKKPTRIDSWKFDLVRRAILGSLKERPGGIPFRELPNAVGKALTPAEQKKLGSLGWYATTVKLELEVRGEIERVEGISPQLLRLP